MSVQWYKLSAEQALQETGSAPGGLSNDEATRRLEQYGPNELQEKVQRTKWQILLDQFKGILTVLLVVAALVSAFLGDWIEAVAILIIVVLNGVLGYTQEVRAEQSIEALKRMSVPIVRVRRDGQLRELSARELVPGDVVSLETGNIVPADGRVLSAVNLRVEEAALTGESEAVDKESELIFEDDLALGDRRNMLYSGTIVNYGRGAFIVTGTGMETELGHIATMLQSVEEEQTPLQARLDSMGRWLAYGALVLVALVIAMGLLRGERDWEILLLTGVSLAVAAVPEALTAVVTIALSLGAQRMLKRHALIRRLPAVETLGSVTIICSDKTGTLTLNRMTVQVADLANHSFRFIHGSGDDIRVEKTSGELEGDRSSALELLLIGAALNSDATLVTEGNGSVVAIGDPTEAALVHAAALLDLPKPELEHAFPRVAEVPFDSARKRMTTLHRMPKSTEGMSAALQSSWETRDILHDIAALHRLDEGRN